jgi:hypothetical protein
MKPAKWIPGPTVIPVLSGKAPCRDRFGRDGRSGVRQQRPADGTHELNPTITYCSIPTRNHVPVCCSAGAPNDKVFARRIVWVTAPKKRVQWTAAAEKLPDNSPL